MIFRFKVRKGVINTAVNKGQSITYSDGGAMSLQELCRNLDIPLITKGMFSFGFQEVPYPSDSKNPWKYYYLEGNTLSSMVDDLEAILDNEARAERIAKSPKEYIGYTCCHCGGGHLGKECPKTYSY